MGLAEEVWKVGTVHKSRLDLRISAREICISLAEIHISFIDLPISPKEIPISFEEIGISFADLPISAFDSRSFAFPQCFSASAFPIPEKDF